MNIITNLVRHITFVQYIDSPCVIIYDKIPADWFGYKIKSNGMNILKVTYEELDKMFVYGFNKTAEYMYISNKK